MIIPVNLLIHKTEISYEKFQKYLFSARLRLILKD